ncbi:MAG: heavy-metal-associated domain-containing protein [Deltaproteobacteria bacterium]|nr:MAG: heavy-metal-associated domain-containing protein [Deltaproteobacteria bacterium]
MRRVLTVLLLSLAAQAAEQSLSLKIEGWHSKGDVYKTEQAVQQVKGVRTVSSDLTKKEMRVVFDDATASAAAIQKAISGAGYLSHR